jgi:hypothetical protein
MMVGWRAQGKRAGQPGLGTNSVRKSKGKYMLYTIAVILLILWLLGLATSYTLGGVIHVLLVIALITVLFNFFAGRRRA